MGKFSIRRHKRELSDSATIVTVEHSMSPSQRSLYGSIISNRPRNRLQKSPHSPPSPQDDNHDAPNDTTKRPQRRLLKKFRLPHHYRTGSLEEKTSVIPPERKPHFNSLPTSPDRPMGLSGRRYANRNWSDNDIRPRSRFPYASPRGSVGSSADILLTPIRGSTAISDEDFVFLTSQDYDEMIHPQGEGAEGPGQTIQSLLTRPDEIRPHPVLLEPIMIEPPYITHSEPLPSEYKPSPSPKLEILPSPAPKPEPELEPEEPLTPMSSTSTSETRTIKNTIVKADPNPPGETSVVLLAEAAINELSPQVAGATEPAPPSREPEVSFQEHRPLSTEPGPTSPLTIDTELPSQRNMIPFPSDLESARTPTLDQWPDSIIIEEPTEPRHTAGATWAISIFQTAEGIMLLALDSYRWLLRKGFRDDFRSCMSYWFLRELVVGFILPLCLTPIALWFLFKTMHDHGLESNLF